MNKTRKLASIGRQLPPHATAELIELTRIEAVLLDADGKENDDLRLQWSRASGCFGPPHLDFRKEFGVEAYAADPTYGGSTHLRIEIELDLSSPLLVVKESDEVAAGVVVLRSDLRTSSFHEGVRWSVGPENSDTPTCPTILCVIPLGDLRGSIRITPVVLKSSGSLEASASDGKAARKGARLSYETTEACITLDESDSKNASGIELRWTAFEGAYETSTHCLGWDEEGDTIKVYIELNKNCQLTSFKDKTRGPEGAANRMAANFIAAAVHLDLARFFCQHYQHALEEEASSAEPGSGVHLANSFLTKLLLSLNKAVEPSEKYDLDELVNIWTEPNEAHKERVRDLSLRIQSMHETAPAVDGLWKQLHRE